MGAVLAAAVWTACGFEVSEELRQEIQRDVEAIEQDGPRMGDMMAAFREAGASYMPELVAPVDLERFQTMTRRRMIVGAYLMDMTYAATFEQHEPSVRFGQALYKLLSDLGFPRPEMERRYREALEQIDEPGGEERLRQLYRDQEKDEQWQAMLETGDGVELVADGLYGFLVEGLYQTTELCVLSGYDPVFLMYVAYMRESLQAYNKLLHRLGDVPELAASVERSDRMNFLASVLVILGDLPEIGRAQIDSLRPAIANARREIVR